MPTDEEKLLRDLLIANWPRTVPQPNIYYDDTQKTADMRFGTIKVYYDRSPPIHPHGIGYTAKEVEFRLKLDVRTTNREQALTIRDTIITILDTVRTRPSANYDYLEYSEGDKTSSYVRNYRWQFVVVLKQLRRLVGGI